MIRQSLSHPVLRKMMMALILTSVEAFLAIICLITGIPILINPGSLAPGSVIALLPGWTIYPWAMGLILGGGTTIVGILFGEYRLERMGTTMLMTLTGVFSLGLVSFLPASFVALITFFLFTSAMAARCWVLSKLITIQGMRIQQIKEESADGTNEHSGY